MRINEKLDEVKHYLRWHRFTPELSTRVKRYYEFYYTRQSAMDEEFIVNQLAPTLRRDVQAHLLNRSIRRLPLFASRRSYVTLDLQLLAHTMLRPLLREAKEPIVDLLEKGTEGGPSVYFVRRGTLVALGDWKDHATDERLTFFEVDAIQDTGKMIGEHSLMPRASWSPSSSPLTENGVPKAVATFTYKAKTRCELYAVSVDDLNGLARQIVEEDKEICEMGQLIWKEHVHHQTQRGLMMRLAEQSARAALNSSPAENLPERLRNLAALRLQTFWVLSHAAWIASLPNSDDTYSAVLPSLYYRR